jgi:hypothetical protein
MGTWSSAITGDDTVADVIGAINDQLKRGATMTEACSAARQQFRSLLSDEDEAPLLWLALAAVQWRHGAVEPDVLARVRADVQQQRGLSRWRENEELLAKRLAALRGFAEQVALPNGSPKPLPKPIVRQASFEVGDCLAVRLDDGRYSAALVLAVDDSNPERGLNLVAGLDYVGALAPTMADFRRRKWLRLRHGQWRGEQDLRWCQPASAQERARLQVVCRLPVRWWHRRRCDWHGPWAYVGQQAFLTREHLGLPDDS